MLRYLHDTVVSRHNVDNKLAVAGALDSEKATDFAWANGLPYTLINNDFTFSIIIIAISFFEEKHFFLRVGNQFCDLLPVTSAVPQGSISGQFSILLYLHG